MGSEPDADAMYDADPDWRHLPDDAHVSGEQMQDDVAAFAEQRGARRLVHHLDEDFRLDVYEVPE